eukprot:CAMPEP_0115150588 /NCGR_PEP_ID=MMETSP0227-20121206/65127_1 /TAXON_ID=89957 /ORGANISM="Polarella glacialis, Strain CCMP 1383" /LENGTH=61 /DNA_ID=CAMNT_0002560979 /DNA_START=354 /DNA_END=536 /DNA_ORIENTATION=+
MASAANPSMAMTSMRTEVHLNVEKPAMTCSPGCAWAWWASWASWASLLPALSVTLPIWLLW